MRVNLNDLDDPIVKAALARKCECGAAPDQPCVPVTGRPFPDGRLIHYARIHQWDIPA